MQCASAIVLDLQTQVHDLQTFFGWARLGSNIPANERF
jgi:hypothetical protein